MTLKEIVEQLESCKFACEAGPLENNIAFLKLKERAHNNAPSVEVKITEADAFKRILGILHHVATTTTDAQTRDFVLAEVENILET
ncbi:hypothetical protein [Brevibacillus massiliensis]|uniref:hypothetical protein n=1 Tax=Brevibacillus massiliensis TaxID=1118054 RepID=UPI000316259B|nr:hypothetical protein [Brevibacillus massiliensis]